LLFRCARLLDEHALAQLRAWTGLPIRPAHTRLFPHIDLGGTRPSELARRLGVSKQAVGPLIAELEQMGVVERVPDPKDRRARLVVFGTAADGAHVLLDGLRMLGQIEAELAAALGPERWQTLHCILTDLLPLIPVVVSGDGPAPDDSPDDSPDNSPDDSGNYSTAGTSD
jgi:DNA-binding transcriptional ArsR family regulator